MLTRRIVNQFLPATVSPNSRQITSTSGAIALAPVAICLVLEAAFLRLGIDDLDEGYFVAQAARVLHGQVPYRDFETLYSPGLLYVHAAAIAVTSQELLGPRLIAFGARAGIAALLFILARTLVRNPVWAAAPALVLLLGLDDAPVRWEPHPGWLSTFFALLAVWCLNRVKTTRWRVASGLAAAASFAFKQNTGLLILLAVLLWSGRRQFLAPLSAFICATLLWLLPLLSSLDAHLSALEVLAGRVNTAGLWSPPEPTIAIPLACIAAGVWLLRRDSSPRVRAYLLAGCALAVTEFPRMDTTHLAWSAPLLLVLAAAALERLSPRVIGLAIAATIVVLAPNISSRVAYLEEPRSTIDGIEAPASTVSDVKGVVADIQARTLPREPIFVYPTSPLLYVLADRPNPTRFDHLNPGAATPLQLGGVISDLDRAGVRLVVISDFWLSAWHTHGGDANAPLETWLDAHFAEVGHQGTYRVLWRNL